MALIDVTKESLMQVIHNYDESCSGSKDPVNSVSGLADFILDYYTPVVPVSPLLLKPSAFSIKDVISGEFIHNFSFCLSERECRSLRLKYFPTAQYKVVKLYEVAE